MDDDQLLSLYDDQPAAYPHLIRLRVVWDAAVLAERERGEAVRSAAQEALTLLASAQAWPRTFRDPLSVTVAKVQRVLRAALDAQPAQEAAERERPVVTDALVSHVLRDLGLSEGWRRRMRQALVDAFAAAPQPAQDERLAIERDAVDTLIEDGWTWDGDQWQRPAAPQPAQPVAVPWRDVVAAIRAVDAEAARRGRMFPQTYDEQDEDRTAVHRVCEMIKWYATNGGSVAESLPGWPKYAAQPAVPEGMVLVPREPTQAMLDAGAACLPGRGAKSLWHEMIAAAPQPAQEAQPAALRCWCESCDMAGHGGMRSRMSVCPACGDKRCPRAAHHDNACDRPHPARRGELLTENPDHGDDA